MRKIATCLALLSIVSLSTASFAQAAKPQHVANKAGHHHHHGHPKPKPPR
jgi:hypothetical protein